MDELHLDDHAGDELSPRAGFRDSLRRELEAEWPGVRPVHRRWQVWAGAAAAVAVTAGVVVAVDGKDAARISPATTLSAPSTSAAPSPTTTLADDELAAAVDGRTWRVWSIDGARTSGTATFILGTDGTITGFDGCNSWGYNFSGPERWRLEGSTLRMPEGAMVGSTAVFCLTQGVRPPLADGTVLQLDDAGQLTLTSPDGAHVAVATSTGTLDVGTVQVPDDPGAPLVREVLWTATKGAGDTQLGWEDCQECDPARPWSPMVSAQGTIVIADSVNGRWVLVRDGDAITVPIDGAIVGQPVFADGFVFVALQPADRPEDVVVRTYDPEEMVTVLEEVDVPDVVYTVLTIDGDRLLAGATKVRGLSPYGAGAAVDPHFDSAPNTMHATWNSARRLWQFPSWAVLPLPLADGSVFVEAELGGVPAFVRLFPDGTTAAGTPAAGNMSYNSQLTADQRGIVQLESDGTTMSVVRYALPHPTATPIALDIESGAILGFAPGPQRADDVVAAVDQALGNPVDDTGWLAVSDQYACSGATQERVVRWNGLGATFVRHDGWEVLAEWSLGEGVLTSDGIGLGSTLDDVRRAWLDRVSVDDTGGAIMTIKWDVVHLPMTFTADAATDLRVSYRLCS